MPRSSSPSPIGRRSLLLGAAAALLAPAVAQAAGYPERPIEIVVPYQAGGGTDALARAFAEASRKHLPVGMVVNNRPGASGAIGWNEVLNAKPDGYKLAMMTVEITTIPHLGLAKFGPDDFITIAQLNADPAAITVKADAPWNTIEEFIAAAKKAGPGAEIKMGNSGIGSIWHLAAAAFEDRTGVKLAHIPFQGANPAVLALMGGHIDAVAVSPAEVSTFVQSGKLKTLAVMADTRAKGFDKVPTLKERNIALSIGTWRGLGVAKGTPPEVVELLRSVTQKTAAEPALREAMDKLNLGQVYGDGAAFKAVVARDNETFKALIPKLNLKP
jgi:tripartite-type tricarboxylate transporter receptor subunit TctC